MSQFPDAKQLFTTVTEDGKSILSIEPYEVPELKEHEVVVRMEAVPINPSDLGLLTAAANMDTVRSETVDGHPALVADVEPAMQPFFKGRAGKKLAAGNEGAGTVVAAGSSGAAQALMGKVVTIVGGEMYRTHRVMPAMMCVPLPEGAPAKEGASLFVNPMTVQGFLNTMRAEGHEALVHTAAASNLGQMLAKLCLKEGVDLVAIVRSDAQKKILTDIGLTHVIDSSKDDFMDKLIAALAETGATLGFDAIGGGKMASYILTAMEKAAAVRLRFDRQQAGLYLRPARHRRNHPRRRPRPLLGRRRLAADPASRKGRRRTDDGNAHVHRRGAQRHLQERLFERDQPDGHDRSGNRQGL